MKKIAVSILFLLAGSAQAQQSLQPEPMSDIKDLGVYHVATDTWTRTGDHQDLGAKTLYRNNATTGFFGVTGQPGKLIWTDEGRIPSTGGHANAKSDSYIVQSFEVVYCTQNGPLPHTLGLTFYECYTSCTDPSAYSPIASFPANTVPGSSAVGVTACWIVTFDLKGTTAEFQIAGDCDEVFDGTTALDNFGWTFELDVAGGGGGLMGPALCSDPNNVPYGDGTYYQNPGSTVGSGLGTADQFWLNDITGVFANGCYWFGGYPSANPYASFWLVLGGDNEGGGLGTKYCTATSNSTGAPADLAMTGTSAAAGDVTATSTPVPNQPSIFFHAANQAQLPFGNGFLCATGNIIRGAVVVGANNVATYTYDNSDAKHSLGNFVGQTRNFQHWYRDPMGGGAAFNTSNAISWTVQ